MIEKIFSGTSSIGILLIRYKNVLSVCVLESVPLIPTSVRFLLWILRRFIYIPCTERILKLPIGEIVYGTQTICVSISSYSNDKSFVELKTLHMTVRLVQIMIDGRKVCHEVLQGA